MKKVIVGISGATGAQLGIRLLEVLHEMEDVETHLVVTRGAQTVIERECEQTVDEVCALADVCYDNNNLAAPISSGSFRTDGMIVAPCSMKSLSAIVNAYDDDLLVRAADVCAKEHRKVVLVPREMPLSVAHCRNILQAAQDGYVLIPPMLTYYNGCETTQDQTDHVIGKVLMQFDIGYDRFRPWKG